MDLSHSIYNIIGARPKLFGSMHINEYDGLQVFSSWRRRRPKH